MTAKLIQNSTIRYINQANSSIFLPAYHSFAIDDALCTTISNAVGTTVVRTWVHRPTIVLGLQDTRLPHLKEGLAFLQQEGYETIVRNSGGLAVVLDDEILNISLLLYDKERKISIDEAYEEMYSLIKDIFSPYTDATGSVIEAKEITHSYCPGSYDLSINDKKFAGISQRRVKQGIAIQIYLCVASSGEKRAETIKNFYHSSIQGEQTKVTYPAIDPSCMASLSQLLQTDLTVETVLHLLEKSIEKQSKTFYQSVLTEEESIIYAEKLQSLSKRNKEILDDYFHE